MVLLENNSICLITLGVIYYGMDRTELRAGLKALRSLVEGLERIVADPSAIARMQARAIEEPSLLLGPTMVDYLGGNPEDTFEPIFSDSL
jgi:hypothetical protein